MTERLYYADAYLTHFSAHVVGQYLHQEQSAVVLDQTAFYPTSGGQPFDRGLLGGVKVVDVITDQDKVVHLLEAPLSDGLADVRGEIDWARRFDHMQQHTGQHVLSQAFLMTAQVKTVSFHLGTDSSTIDLLGPNSLLAEDMERAELLANEVVWENRPVLARIVSSSELPELPLRGPPTVSGDVRIIQVADFDWSACGGTHVAQTGEIGAIKVIKWERRGKELRVEFRCGRRALLDYAHKNSMINHVAAGLNVGFWELDDAVERLVGEVKDVRSQLRQAQRLSAQYQADVLRAAALHVAGVRLVVHSLSHQPIVDMRELARQLVSQEGVVALLGAGDQNAQLVFARSSDVDVDMVPLMRETATRMGSRGGGGRPDYAQGGGPVQDAQQLDSLLDWAAETLRAHLKD